MRRRLAGSTALLLLLVASCAGPQPPATSPPTAAEFEQMRDILASNPEARAFMEAQCRSDVDRKPEVERAMLGALLDLDPDRVASGFCARALAGITRGDVSYADFVAMTKGSEDPQILRRFIRALRLDPSAVAI
jgi:hypothetical protein